MMTNIYIYIRDVAKKNETIVEGWVLLVKDKSNHPVAGGIGNMFVSVQCSECQSDEISNKRG